MMPPKVIAISECIFGLSVLSCAVAIRPEATTWTASNGFVVVITMLGITLLLRTAVVTVAFPSEECQDNPSMIAMGIHYAFLMFGSLSFTLLPLYLSIVLLLQRLRRAQDAHEESINNDNSNNHNNNKNIEGSEDVKIETEHLTQQQYWIFAGILVQFFPILAGKVSVRIWGAKRLADACLGLPVVEAIKDDAKIMKATEQAPSLVHRAVLFMEYVCMGLTFGAAASYALLDDHEFWCGAEKHNNRTAGGEFLMGIRFASLYAFYVRLFLHALVLYQMEDASLIATKSRKD
ncbi:expressed unknown protein [Seminavis robusta]|uniref:Uncharacterized protein n=1 Tax=Seminavis robusta TaxID=568900 RepID=A0A9N8ES67_9STRA|nr:expressed unknown protein [Seminavis robusta]|eukprot:Sro1545_g281360.1 n/a (291) ;mRNA; f:24336-25208